MSYVDSLLADGEEIVLRTRQHWLALVTRPRRGWLLLLLALVALLLGLVVGGENAAGTVRADAAQALGVAGFALLVLAALTFLLHAWRWWSAAYIVTNRRVVQVEGIVNKRAADSSLEKINDAVLTQGLGGRVFGYGDLEVLTASESAIDRFRMLRDAPGFKRTMLNEKLSLERDLAFRPGPPIRMAGPASGVPGAPVVGATPGGGPAAPGPLGSVVGSVAGAPRAGSPGPAGALGWNPESGGSAAGGAQVPDALIVTQTLARLAELRDRGAITEDDYQAKKAELLQRL